MHVALREWKEYTFQRGNARCLGREALIPGAFDLDCCGLKCGQHWSDSFALYVRMGDLQLRAADPSEWPQRASDDEDSIFSDKLIAFEHIQSSS